MKRLLFVVLTLCFVVVSPVYAQSAADGQYLGSQGEGCTTIGQVGGNTSKSSPPFDVDDTTVILTYFTEPLNDRGFNSTDISLVDFETFSQINSVEAVEGEDGQLSVNVERGRYQVDVSTFEQSYIITVQVQGGEEECLEDPSGGGPNPPSPPVPPIPGPPIPGPPIFPDPPVVPDPPKDIIMPPELIGKELANTGGVSLVSGAGVLCVAAGLLVLNLVRRR